MFTTILELFIYSKLIVGKQDQPADQSSS